MPHQSEGIAFLLREKVGLLAFEQGLGKTRVALEAFATLRRGHAQLRLLVICPNSLKQNWVAEASKFTPHLSTIIVTGTAKKRRLQLASVQQDVVVVSYELARGETIPLRAMLKRSPHVLLFDESHTVKNRESFATIAAGNLVPLAEYRWLLTGTPATNSPGDIYSQVRLITGDASLGSFDSFMAEYGNARQSEEVARRLGERIAPYVLRRTKAECLTLPEKHFVDVFVPLPSWQRELYDAARDGLVADIHAMSVAAFRRFAPTALTRLLRLSQIASNPRLVAPEESREHGKAIQLDRIIADVLADPEQKIIIWSSYVRSIEEMERRYASYGTAVLYGKVPAEERQSVAERFQTDRTVRVLIANPAAAGTGFTLTTAGTAVYESMTWRYDFYAQSQDRNHRIGQMKSVRYVRMIAEHTIEETIASALDSKAAMAAALFGEGSAVGAIAQMDPEQFCSMLMSNRLE